MATNASSREHIVSDRQIDPAIPARRPVVKPLRIDSGLDIDKLDLKTRTELGAELYDIFCESYGQLDRATVCDEIVFRPGGILYLIRDAVGILVGFSLLATEEVTVDGQVYGVMHGGIYCRRHVRGAGALWTKRAVRALLAEKVRKPTRPLYYLCEALTPISYRRTVRSFPTTFPSYRNHTSQKLTNLLNALLDRQGLTRPGAHPFVVKYPDPASHRDVERMTLNEALRSDPDVEYYLEQNPDFAEGNILCALVPLNFADLLRSFTSQFLPLVRKG